MWNICWDYVIYERGVDLMWIVDEKGGLASSRVDNNPLYI